MENYNMVLWQHFKCWRSNVKKIHINSLKLLNSLFPFGRSLMFLLIPLSGRHVRKKKKKKVKGLGGSSPSFPACFWCNFLHCLFSTTTGWKVWTVGARLAMALLLGRIFSIYLSSPCMIWSQLLVSYGSLHAQLISAMCQPCSSQTLPCSS